MEASPGSSWVPWSFWGAETSRVWFLETTGCPSCSTWQVSTTASLWAEEFTRSQLVQLKVPSLFSMRVKVTSVQNMIPFSNQVSCKSLG